MADANRIILINAPLAGERQLPIELAYLSTKLTADGFLVEGVDCADGHCGIERRIAASKNLLGILVHMRSPGVMSYPPDWEGTRGLISKIKSVSPAPIGLSGQFPTLHAPRCLKECPVDFVVCGNHYSAVPRAFHLLRNGTRPPRIIMDTLNGVKQYHGTVTSFGIPDARLFDFTKYMPTFFSPRANSFPLLTSIGCAYRCFYCFSSRMWGHDFYCKPPGDVVREIRHLSEEFGIRHFVIEDDLFNYDRARLIRICRRITKENLNITWECINGLRVDHLDEELIGEMARAGCIHIALGLETFNDRVLRQLGRQFDRDHLVVILGACHNLNVRTTGYFIVNLPGNRGTDALQDIMASLRLKLTFAHYSLLQHYPATSGKGISENAVGMRTRMLVLLGYLLFYCRISRMRVIASILLRNPSRTRKIVERMERILISRPPPRRPRDRTWTSSS